MHNKENAIRNNFCKFLQRVTVKKASIKVKLSFRFY